MPYPKMTRIRQEFNTQPIKDIPETVRSELKKLSLRKKIRPGAKVAITAGSRGIANLATVIATLVDELKALGAKPFIIPAMGSHGGATAKGQQKILAKYGITKESMGAPIKSTMNVIEIGETAQGLPVFLDRYAHQADHIVVINRIKPHTDFKASIESGLMKMMAIGLGKQKGAELYHRGVIQYGYHAIILAVGREVLKRCPVAFGLALVENQRDETAVIRAVTSDKIEETERNLLRRAKRFLPKIPLNCIDLLIIDRMGKEISGTGMDTNVIGRSVFPLFKHPAKPNILRIFVRDLMPHTDGNAVGIGNADFTTRRLVEKIDRQVTYMNSITACEPEVGRIPLYYDTDRQVLEAAFKSLGLVEPQNARIVHIADTLHLEKMDISETLLAEAGSTPGVMIAGKPKPMAFDRKGNLISRLSG